jgi:hypothetical protein
MARKRLTHRVDKMKQAASNGLRREISDDFKYNKNKLKHLKHILHNLNVALGTLVSSLNEFSRIKGPDISPDGLLGGLGYIMAIRDIKEVLNGSAQKLSDIADCLADELTNPKWEASDDKDVKELIKEKERIEEKVDEETAPRDDEDNLTPEDVVTSTDIDKTASISKKAKDMLAEAVKQSLVNFNTGKKQ